MGGWRGENGESRCICKATRDRLAGESQAGERVLCLIAIILPSGQRCCGCPAEMSEAPRAEADGGVHVLSAAG